MKLALAVLKFFFISALIIVSNENLALSDPMSRHEFSDRYYDWMRGLFINVKQVTGYVINSEWLPGAQNETIIETG